MPTIRSRKSFPATSALNIRNALTNMSAPRLCAFRPMNRMSRRLSLKVINVSGFSGSSLSRLMPAFNFWTFSIL